MSVTASAYLDPSTLRSVAIVQQFSYEIKVTIILDHIKPYYQKKVYADIKLTTYNFIQTPLGADKISLIGSLNIKQRNPFEQGSAKRVVNYDTDDLQSYLETKTLNDFIMKITAYNTTGHINSDFTQISIPSGSNKKVDIEFDIQIPTL